MASGPTSGKNQTEMRGKQSSDKTMKYCYGCNHLTPGDPLFCNSCGHSYDVKLCPRRHRNPRTAEACSQCGSRDLSTPQPRRPGWVPFLGFILRFVPGAFLSLATVAVLVAAVIGILRHPEMIISLLLLTIPFAILWSMWMEIPLWFRNWIYRLLKRRRDRGNGDAE